MAASDHLDLLLYVLADILLGVRSVDPGQLRRSARQNRSNSWDNVFGECYSDPQSSAAEVV